MSERGDADVAIIDLHTRLKKYSERDIEWVIESGVPIVTFDEWDRGGMSSDVWPQPLTNQQSEIFYHITHHNIKVVHFCRLMDKTQTYPSNLFPYEKPILYEEPILTPDELFNREYDVCFIANTAPQRESISKTLLNDERLKCIVSMGAKKIPFRDWVDVHRKAKLFVSASGGGFSNERPQNLFSIAGMIQEQTNQLLLHPFEDMLHCIKINTEPTKDQLDYIYDTANSKDDLYKIYKNNYDFMKTFYSKEYIASNIIETIEKQLN